METLIAVAILFLAVKLGASSLYTALFGTKAKRKKPKPQVISKKPARAQDPRDLAIQELMKKVEKAKLNHPDLVQDPERAAKILKLWVNQDKNL